jgi:hypothetical protein
VRDGVAYKARGACYEDGCMLDRDHSVNGGGFWLAAVTPPEAIQRHAQAQPQ